MPYSIKHYQRNEHMRAPKELTDIHPLGKSPIITDGDTTLAETGAIIGMVCSLFATFVLTHNIVAFRAFCVVIQNIYCSSMILQGTISPLTLDGQIMPTVSAPKLFK